jgi:hypothetical protein
LAGGACCASTRSRARDTAELVRIVAEVAVRTTTLPLQIEAMIADGILRGPRQVDERRLLKNAEDEYAIAARALAACRVGQRIAEQAHDQTARDLLASLRRQDEQLLKALEDSLAEDARAGPRPTGDARHLPVAAWPARPRARCAPPPAGSTKPPGAADSRRHVRHPARSAGCPV